MKILNLSKAELDSLRSSNFTEKIAIQRFCLLQGGIVTTFDFSNEPHGSKIQETFNYICHYLMCDDGTGTLYYTE